MKQTTLPIREAAGLSVRVGRALPAWVLALSLATTYALWHGSQRDVDHLRGVEFAAQVKDIHSLIAQRLVAYEQVLRGAAGLFAASRSVARHEFQAYVAALNLRERYPGIQGVGFSLAVPARDRAKHIERMRRQGFPDYALHPDGGRDPYTSIIYLEPFADRNLRAFGYDMFSEAVRRAAMERARDTGDTAVSGKVRLLQETERDAQAGFLMYLPVYRNGAPHAASAERRANLVGWVYEPFRMDDLMLGILGQRAGQVDVAIYDGAGVSPESLMHDSGKRRPWADSHRPAHVSVQPLEIGGHRWTVAVRSRPEFERQREDGKPRIVAWAGTAFGLMLYSLTWMLARGRARAIRYAQRMNRELIKSEAGFRALFEQSPAGVFSTDSADGRIRRANPKIADMLGYTVEELEGMTVLDLTHPGDLPQSRDSLGRLLTGSIDHYHLEKRYLRKDGRPLWVDLFATALRAPNGDVIDNIAVITDIDERKRWHAALAESEARFHSLFTDSKVAMLLIDPASGRIVDANQSACAYYGYPHERLLRLGIGDINTLPSEGVADAMGQAGSGRNHHFEFKHRLANGERRDVEVHSGLVAVSGQSLLYSIVHDITDRKRAEERLRQLSTVIEQGPASVMITGLDGGILYVNPRFTEVTGYGLEEVLGENPRFLQSGQTPEATYAELWTTLAAGGVWHGEFVNRKKNGEFYYEEAYISPVRNEAGKTTHYSAIKLDITRRKWMEEELLLASSVYRASAEAMVVTDAANRIVAVNPAFTRTTGYALPEVLGRNPKLLSSGRQGAAFYGAMWRALTATGHWQGEIWNRRKDGELFAEWLTINAIRDPEGRIHRYVALFSDITEKKRSDELIWEQANFDPLTRLPNRRLFRDRLQQELGKTGRAGLSLALMFIDLDHFKEVNDTLGHDFGDSLLVEAARRIRRRVRDSDTVARLGGDEFTVILPQLADTAHVERVALDIVEALGQPFELGPETVYVSASVGITMYPGDAGEIEDLLKNADQAMYVAKNLGRNGFSFFTPSMQEAARERLRLINDLRNALALGQFEVHFQPIVALETGLIVKAEALLRWRHPERGWVGPDRFIPLAEETGLIHGIGDWVFRESVRWALEWRARGWTIQISVNKSPVQFIAGHCHSDWEDYLRSVGLPGESLTIEITEGLLLKDRADVVEKLRGLHGAGIQVAIDDFGTGYSSLSYLKRFDIDYLKIDRSFVRGLDSDPGDLALTEAIVVMAHKLGLRVIAEGVETARQRDLLAAAGCDYGQGYLFAKPVPAGEFETLLGSGAGRGAKERTPLDPDPAAR